MALSKNTRETLGFVAVLLAVAVFLVIIFSWAATTDDDEWTPTGNGCYVHIHHNNHWWGNGNTTDVETVCPQEEQ